MEIRQGHRPFRIYQPTLVQVKDDTPALLLNRQPQSSSVLFYSLVHYMGEEYWYDKRTGAYSKTYPYFAVRA